MTKKTAAGIVAALLAAGVTALAQPATAATGHSLRGLGKQYHCYTLEGVHPAFDFHPGTVIHGWIIKYDQRRLGYRHYTDNEEAPGGQYVVVAACQR